MKNRERYSIANLVRVIKGFEIDRIFKGQYCPFKPNDAVLM